MINWPTKKLGEICEIISPGIKKFDGVKKYVATADVGFDKIVNFAEITYKRRPSRANMEPRENDVLVARMAETNKFLIVNKKLQDNYIFSTGFAVLRAKKELLPKYLFYFFTTKDFNLQKDKLAVGATQKAINNPALKKIKISILPVPIQQKIVERLDAIKKAQELNDKQIELAEELYRSLLHNELNTKFKSQKSKLQFKIKKLREVITINYGKGLSKSERKENGKYFAYGSNGPVYKTNKILVNNPTIIIGRKGAVGALYLVKDPSWPIDTTFYVEIKNKDELDLYFLYFLLQTINLQYLAIVTAVPGINRDSLYNIKIPLPPLESQQKIVEKLSAVQEYKKKLLEQKQKLQELFESVLNKAFKGELIK
jgi:type I restriction enzyme S subunit